MDQYHQLSFCMTIFFCYDFGRSIPSSTIYFLEVSALVSVTVVTKILLELKNPENLAFLGYYSKAKMEGWE